jgi:hypothetical protein
VIPGRTLPTGREIAWHEAYHAAALCIAGMVPKCVRSDWPSDHEAGDVTIDWGTGDTGIRQGRRTCLCRSWPARSRKGAAAGIW